VNSAPVCKTDLLLALIRGGEWNRALSLANRFRLFPPDVKRAIRQGHAAGTNPRLYRGMGRDPEQLVAAGRAALLRHYGARL
jgi:hypothetical protein